VDQRFIFKATRELSGRQDLPAVAVDQAVRQGRQAQTSAVRVVRVKVVPSLVAQLLVVEAREGEETLRAARQVLGVVVLDLRIQAPPALVG